MSGESLREALGWLQEWALQHVLTLDSAAQLAAIAATFAIAWLLARPARAAVRKGVQASGLADRIGRAQDVALSLVLPVAWLVLLGGVTSLARGLEHQAELTRISATLLAAWVVIRITSSLIAEPFWSRTAAVVAWSIAALNVLHLLAPTLEFLDGLAVTFGSVRVSALSLLKGVGLAGVLLWGAVSSSRIFQQRVEQLPSLTPSVQVLISQTFKVSVITLAIVVALASIGLDLTAFAVFSGAVGVGVGFGLQKIVSNLISGIILLLDRSIKPGDVIEVGGTFGTVNSLGARYASIVTRDGTEFLIPNEDLITLPVANWSYSSNLVRRKVPVGISYDSDLDLATTLILDAAHETDRILDQPGPNCHLTGFGSSSVDLELRFWIDDPQNGVSNVADQVLRRIWRKFQDGGIQIPYPQRDLHIRTPGVLQVASAPAAGDGEPAGAPGAPEQ